MNLHVLGLDPSLNTGYAEVIYDSSEAPGSRVVRSGVIKSQVKKGWDRFNRYSAIAGEMLEIVEQGSWDIIVIEGYSFNSKFNGVTMGEIGGILRYFLWQLQDLSPSIHSLVEVPPTSLKLFVTGKGNCKKEMIIKEVYKRWGYEASNNDIADAVGLAMFGVAWLGGEVGLPNAHMKAVDNVRSMIEKEKK